jgi:hypothetical protein
MAPPPHRSRARVILKTLQFIPLGLARGREGITESGGSLDTEPHS